MRDVILSQYQFVSNSQVLYCGRVFSMFLLPYNQVLHNSSCYSCLVEENFSREYFSSQFGSEMHAGLLPKKIPQLDFSKKCFLKSHIYYSEKPMIGEISPIFY